MSLYPREGNSNWTPPESAIITTGVGDRRWQYCRCRACNLVTQCTPVFDFFQLAGEPMTAGILCEPCFTTAVTSPIRGAA